MTSLGRSIRFALLAAIFPVAACLALQPAPASAPAEANGPAAASPVEPPVVSPVGPPAVSPVEPPDLVKEILAYDALEEQVRFQVACREANSAGGGGLAAAAEPNELTRAAFEENRKHHTPFVRRYDRWYNILLFDRNGNGTIGWLEASEYRAALRNAILAAYDTNHDGLTTPENRAAANKALAEGKLPELVPPKLTPTPPTTHPAQE